MNMQMMEPIRYVDYRIYNVTKIKNFGGNENEIYKHR